MRNELHHSAFGIHARKNAKAGLEWHSEPVSSVVTGDVVMQWRPSRTKPQPGIWLLVWRREVFQAVMRMLKLMDLQTAVFGLSKLGHIIRQVELVAIMTASTEILAATQRLAFNLHHQDSAASATKTKDPHEELEA